MALSSAFEGPPPIWGKWLSLRDPVQVHSAERIGMLGPEVDDLDSRGLAPFVLFLHPVKERGLLDTTGLA